MAFEIAQIVQVSVFNRLRGHKPYCKPHKVMQITRTHIVTSPIHFEDNPRVWLRFGRSNLTYVSKLSKTEYRIWKSVDAFDRSVLEGYYKGI